MSSTGTNKKKRKSQAELALKILSRQGVKVWHSPKKDPYMTTKVDGHWEHWPLASRRAGEVIGREFYASGRGLLCPQALRQVVGEMSARALSKGREHETYTRVGELGEKIYIDLCNDEWTVIEVGREGWEKRKVSPVRFVRSPGMMVLPDPLSGGGLVEDLASILNVRRSVRLRGKGSTEYWEKPYDDDLHLLVAWLLFALRSGGPFPALVPFGPQGSAKTTLSRAVKRLVDPNKADTRPLFRDEEQLMLGASTNWVLVFDNVSEIRSWQSDALCRLSTGGAYVTRKLYTNEEEHLFAACRPMIINGITNVVRRSDLVDRSIVIKLPRLTEKISEGEYWKRFRELHPRILGSLLDGVAGALREADMGGTCDLRMVDFVKFVTGAESALGLDGGTFERAYRRNRRLTNLIPLDDSPVYGPLLQVIPFEGSAQELLGELQDRVGDRYFTGWPRNEQVLSRHLRAIEPNLTAEGIVVEWRRSGGKRTISIGKRTRKEENA